MISNIVINCKPYVPWWVKLIVKLSIAGAPLKRSHLNKFGICIHGEMTNIDYARNVFKGHTKAAGLSDGGALRGKTILELGPGDSVATAAFAYQHGAKAILVDVGDFAANETDLYEALISAPGDSADAQQSKVEPLTRDQFLKVCGASYHTFGLTSLAAMPSSSVDFIFSQAVLEHIPRADFHTCIAELHRILRPNGIASHVVDFRDHLGDSLHSLRFPDHIWESKLFAESGFYTNRLRLSEVVNAIKETGEDVKVCSYKQFATLPVRRSRLNGKYKSMSSEDLLTKEAHVVSQKTVSFQ